MIRSYPAALSNAVAVASLDDDNKKSSFSNFGPWVDVAAPGRDIISTLPADSRGPDSGTSMAAPVVAGVAGLYLALNPDVSFDELRNRIIDCADASIYTADAPGPKFNAANYFPLVAGEEAHRPLLGSGIVNVRNMITGSCKGSVGRPLDRVTPGCSSIDGLNARSSIIFLFIFVLFPSLVKVFGRVKV
jgi:subtilisin family serine protease